MPTMPNQYYEDFDQQKYNELLFIDGRHLQGRELNNLQKQVKHHIGGIASALFKDGDIVEAAQIIVNESSGAVTAQAGRIFLDGDVRDVPEATFTVPTSGSVAIGVYLEETVVSELEDPALRNPATGNRGEGQPGAWRIKLTARWGFAGDGGAGKFYPVHTIEDGTPRSKEAPPTLDSFNQGIARYDRDSTGGGTYISSGLIVRVAEDAPSGEQVYTVSEGRARVYGYGADLPTSRRLTYPAAPDLRYIDTEIHTADGTAAQRINVAHGPIHNIAILRATLKKTVSMVHGSYSGAADALPDTAVVNITECKQGATIYVPGTDYKKTGDAVDWAPAGNEPAPGSTYSVTYTYMATVEAEQPDYDGFTITGAVAGSSIILSYNQALPRLDSLCLTQEGAFVWQQGVAAELNPRRPATPEGMLAIATVAQSWRETPQVINDGIRVMTFSAMEALESRIDYVMGEVARQRLEADISTREAGARVGVFVDPLVDDSQRDQGLAQSAAVAGGELGLAVAPTAHPLPKPKSKAVTANFSPSIILAQTLRTGSMPVNPYMAFGVLPAQVELDPPLDQWTEVESLWTSPVTQVFNYTLDGEFHRIVGQSSSAATQVVNKTSKNIEYLRQISIAFTLKGFGPGEVLREVVFDGVPATFTAVPANSSGELTGHFNIPAKIPAGAKTVLFKGGEGGSSGSAPFVGQGQLTVQTLRSVFTVVNYWVDPLAQTFVLDAPAQICGVDLWFTAKSGPVRVQLREVQNGLPTRVILAEAVLAPENIIVSGGGHTRVNFPVLVQLLANTEYAVVVLCNDAITALAVAEMGKFDATVQKWVTAQPYTVGVLLSSSNASTWTAHQTQDLAFRLLAANFAAGPHQIDMGSVTVSNATDFILLALDEQPTADTRVEYTLDLPDGQTLRVSQGQPVRLPAPLSGAVKVKAALYNAPKAAPLLWPGAQLLAGAIDQSGSYYTRSITALGATSAVLVYDAIIPSGATVTPEIQIDGGAWKALTAKDAVNQGDGVVEYKFGYTLSNATLVKCRFTLTGGTAARPKVRNIRFMALK